MIIIAAQIVVVGDVAELGIGDNEILGNALQRSTLPA
jgi:hypothetical protein